MRLSLVQRALFSLIVLTGGVLLYSVRISMLLLDYGNVEHRSLQQQRQEPQWGSPRNNLDNSNQQTLSRPRPPLPGSTSCDTVLQNVRKGLWMDPNKDGQHYVRRIITSPHHYVSVHHPDYDRLRYDSIFVKGEYYERKVHARFESILQEEHQQSHNSTSTTPMVVDVGANIGYYSLLSAAYRHDVVSFEINPSNLIRLCESIQWNSFYYNGDFGTIHLFRNGVSNQNGTPVQVVVPKRNPGEAKIFPMTEKQQHQAQSMANTTFIDTDTNNHQDLRVTQYHSFATTVALDAFAQEQGWFAQSSYPRQDIAILKIDTEGHEPQILQGARKLLQSHIVRNVLMEYRTSCRDAVFEILLQNGYVLVYDEPSTNRPRTMLSREQSKTVIERIHQTWETDNAKEDVYEDLWFRLASHKLPSSSKARSGGIRTAKT